MQQIRGNRSFGAWILVAAIVCGGGVGRPVEVTAGESPFRTRAVWIPPSSFDTPETAEATLNRCDRAGFNVLLPDVMVNQAIAFRSPHFAGRVTATDEFDPLAHFARGAHDRGMKVEAWCCVYYEGASSRGLPPLHPEWLVRSLSGQPFHQRFLSPSIPAANDYLLSVIADLLEYGVDGVHLDYIRYPGTCFDYSAAGRESFRAEAGFDPLDFLDHADRLVDPGQESYPVRVLFPREHAEKAWETTSIERTLDQESVGYAFVRESPVNVARLAAPGLLILSSYDKPSDAMIAALSNFVARGGDILWIGPPDAGLTRSALLRRLLGLGPGRWVGAQRVALAAGDDHPLQAATPRQRFTVETSSSLVPEGAVVAVRLADGTPAITVNRPGGRAVVAGPHFMKSVSPASAATVAAIVAWLRTEAGADPGDPLAEMRRTWIDWRSERVTRLVRAIHDLAAARRPPLTVSSSGGPSPAERYGCYRDAGRWLAEGINEHVFPMNYTENPDELDDLLRVQSASAPPGTKASIFPGLQTYRRVVVDGHATARPQDAALVRRQLQLVRQHGYGGFAIFAYNTLSDEVLEVVRLASQGRLD